MTALARVSAVSSGVAQRIATVRHVHLSDRPLVFIPLALAGEANAPLAALVGSSFDSPQLLVVLQPRNRDERFAFAARLAAVFLSYVDSFRGETETVPAGRNTDPRERYVDAPQILVPNGGGVGFVRLLGRSTRFRRTEGEYAVEPSVPLLGRWLTFFAERAEYPGSSLLLNMTGALGMHWATGQSAVEDANLAALVGWIDPPDGMTGADAALEAEDPLTWPPAGPATDPTFDNEILAPAIEAGSLSRLESALRRQLEPTWELMWRGVSLLRNLPPGARVERRWAEDRDAFTGYASYVDEGGYPQARRDGAVAAAQRLARLERAQVLYDAQRAYDDPLILAEYRLTGEAFAGTVTASAPDRIDDSGKRRVLRPRVTVSSSDPVRFEPGVSVVSPARPSQTGRVVSVSPLPSGFEVVLELSGGMGRGLTAPPGSVPEVGERLTYTTLTESYQAPAAFPAREETPWTHGGPPVEYVPDDDDAVEEWS
nr:hypothetical protein [Planosporangium thailandense]